MIDYEREFIPYVPPEPGPTPTWIDDSTTSDESTWSSSKIDSVDTTLKTYFFQIKNNNGKWNMRKEGLFDEIKNAVAIALTKNHQNIMVCDFTPKHAWFITCMDITTSNVIVLSGSNYFMDGSTLKQSIIHLTIPKDYTTSTEIGTVTEVTITPDV